MFEIFVQVSQDVQPKNASPQGAHGAVEPHYADAAARVIDTERGKHHKQEAEEGRTSSKTVRSKNLSQNNLGRLEFFH